MKRKSLWNGIMAAAAVLMVLSGIMVAVTLRGWVAAPGQASGTSALVTKKLGNANLERSGLAYALTENTALKNGDILETLHGSQAHISSDNAQVTLNENSEMQLVAREDGVLQLQLSRGEAFLQVAQTVALSVAEWEITAENAVLSLSVHPGSATVFVLGGEITAQGNTVPAGKTLSFLQDGTHENVLILESLNEFTIENALQVGETEALCFTNEALQNVVEQRKEEMRRAMEARLLAQQQEKAEQAQLEAAREKNRKKWNAAAAQQPSALPESQAPSLGVPPEDVKRCTIEIRCDTILNNMADLTEGKNQYVPADGTVLAVSTLAFTEGETVFDVLKKACELAGLQLEYSFTPLYNSYYIEGINHLYEFDCGSQSGWMYKVNGWFPNYGCSGYALKDGDAIVWTYTCKGLGADIGGSAG